MQKAAPRFTVRFLQPAKWPTRLDDRNMTDKNTSLRKRRPQPICLDVQSWRRPSEEEMLEWLESKHPDPTKRPKPSLLIVRQQLSPLDVYCYLKARFGEPNGFQNWLRQDTSDNWIHWDYYLKAGDEDVYLCGMSREIHCMVSEKLTDGNWRDLVLAVKADYGRVGKDKSAVLKSLEHWVTFPNKFVEIADICAELHAEILDNMGRYQSYKTPSFRNKKTSARGAKLADQLAKRSVELYRHCLELSLLTPVLAEAFINMVVLILCKQEIRRNKRQFEEFIRSNIDVKLFDLFYKCEGFAKAIDQDSEEFKSFKRVMDKRNNAIHGNCDPEREKIEHVYFEGKRPLFPEPGDHIGKFFEALERQHQPNVVIKDYEETYAFLLYILECLIPGQRRDVWRILEDSYPGYDVNRKIAGCLFDIFPAHPVRSSLKPICVPIPSAYPSWMLKKANG
ncbi:MAG: hypothetical protein LAP13_19305, partial [Acidobacteriia bacterium]|nr:hypothetical protein [Terriglobia bacterium]